MVAVLCLSHHLAHHVTGAFEGQHDLKTTHSGQNILDIRSDHLAETARLELMDGVYPC